MHICINGERSFNVPGVRVAKVQPPLSAARQQGTVIRGKLSDCTVAFTGGGDLQLVVPRKCNSLWPHLGWVEFYCQYVRKRVETTFSRLTEELARSIHAVTARGFERKVFLTVMAYSILGEQLECSIL